VARYRIIRQRVRVTRHPERKNKLVLVIVDEDRTHVDWAWGMAEARRKLAALRQEQREAA
jgi:hypothetical protein